MFKTISLRNIFFAILFISISCNKDDQRSDLLATGEGLTMIVDQEKFQQMTSLRKGSNGEKVSDSFEILNLEREGNNLKVDVRYNGGCVEHSFELIWDGGIMESYPCQIHFIMSHNSNNDQCDGVIEETLILDIEEFIGNNAQANSCIMSVYSVLNNSDDPDGTVTTSNN